MKSLCAALTRAEHCSGVFALTVKRYQSGQAATEQPYRSRERRRTQRRAGSSESNEAVRAVVCRSDTGERFDWLTAERGGETDLEIGQDIGGDERIPLRLLIGIEHELEHRVAVARLLAQVVSGVDDRIGKREGL